jgi:hypothetical protein
MDISHFPGNSQPHPCRAILYRTDKYHESHFRGSVVLESGSFFWIALFIATDRADQEHLRLYLQPELCKTPVGAYPGKSRRYFAILRRTSPKRYGWESDFKGLVVLEGRIYQLGVHICIDRSGRQYLQLYLRPALPKTPTISRHAFARPEKVRVL